jgi:ubiquinone/menaquinone biosynthesis C-methylase UbiE
MNDLEVGNIWNRNAEAWTHFTRGGYDLYRDVINTPSFLSMLPPLDNLHGLDIGCGEGHNTRLIAQRCAKIDAIDISPAFIRYACDIERGTPLGIRYVTASAVNVPFADQCFDFCTALMTLMDIPEQQDVVREIYRVLRPNGFFQFSILHPCFFTASWRWVSNEYNERVGMLCGQYFDPPQGMLEEWNFETAPLEDRKKFPTIVIPHFRRTLSDWLNLLLEAGFAVERMNEPSIDEETADRYPMIADARIVPLFLHVRCRRR